MISGFGIGYEILHLSASSSNGSTSLNFSGVELANLAVGADFKVSPQLSLGSWAGMSVGEFSGAAVNFGGLSVSNDLPDKAFHLWLDLGIQGTFNLPIR